MGKASRWFRGLLGLKNADPDRNHPQRPPPKKKKWGFAVSQGEKDRRRATAPAGGGDEENDAGRHAVAVAAATAAVAEAAVAAAQAAAAVVRLTSSGRSISTAGGGGGGARREEWAAVTVQSHFRAYLSRRALRALKALVKLQALVRGHLVRKQTAYALRRLQALVRAQARARAGRVLNSESPQSSNKSSHFNYPGPPTPEKSERVIRTRSMKHDQLPLLKRNGSKSNSTITYDPEKPHTARIIRLDSDKTDKILEVDNGNPKNCQTFSTSKDSTARQSVPSPSSGEAQSPSPLMFAQDVDESAFCSADNSPTYYSASSRGCSSRKSAFTPTKSDSSRSCFSNYSDHPNYMSYTESSKAKVRSLSAPKQRPHQIERSSSTKRYSIHGYGDLRSGQRVSALQANFTSKAYPGSGRLDRLGMPIRGDISGGYWHRY